MTKRNIIILEDGKMIRNFITNEQMKQDTECNLFKVLMSEANTIDGVVLVLDAKEELSSKLREYILLCKQFHMINFLMWIKNCHFITNEERKEKVSKIQELLKEYGVEQIQMICNNETSFSKEEVIQSWIENIQHITLEEEPLPMILESHENHGIRNFVNTYRKTRKSFSSKLDK